MSSRSSKQKWISTFQFLAAYLVAAWTFLQFVDWALNRYNLSPNWVDLLLWTFIGIIPSLIIYIYHRERINKGVIKLREKILIPANVILLGSVLFFAFGNADLGATTKNVTFENSLGNLETKTFTKEEFRKGFKIYSFKQLNENDSLNKWLKYGIGKIVLEDLLQNKNLRPEFNNIISTTDKIRDASLFYDKYVDGTYEVNSGIFKIKTTIRKATNAKILNEKEFEGENLFTLLDTISEFIASEMDKKSNLTYIDLPINEHITNSIEALKAFVIGDYDRAYSIDNRFALAYLQQAKQIMLQNSGQLEAQDVIDKAFVLKSKLPMQKQLEVLIQKNIAYDNYDEAEQQVKLQLEVDPNNTFYNLVLFSLYGEAKNTEDYFKASEKLFNSNKSSTNGNNLSIAAMVVGYEDQLLSALSTFEIIDPYLKYLKIEPLVFKGDVEAAKEIFEDYKLTYTGRNTLKAYDTIFKFLENKSVNDIKTDQFVGFYRSNYNESTLEFWTENNRLIEYVKNQPMKAYLPAGTDAVAGGNITNFTYYSELVRDDNLNIIGMSKTYYNWNSTPTIFFWKMNETLIKANEAFENKEFDLAYELYQKAKLENPNHIFIDNILSHLEYKTQNSSLSTLALFKTHEGKYGARKFWVENQKFYYKRQDEDTNLAKVELLPINDTLFMDMTRLGTLMAFTNEDGRILSKSYSYDIKKQAWYIKEKQINVLEKSKLVD